MILDIFIRMKVSSFPTVVLHTTFSHCTVRPFHLSTLRTRVPLMKEKNLPNSRGKHHSSFSIHHLFVWSLIWNFSLRYFLCFSMIPVPGFCSAHNYCKIYNYLLEFLIKRFIASYYECGSGLIAVFLQWTLLNERIHGNWTEKPRKLLIAFWSA